MSYAPNILIIDDEPLMCDSLKALLSTQGYEIHTANSGKEALEYLAKNSFDLVLLDIVIADMDGHRLMHYINSQDLETVFIVMTGHPSVESAIDALRSGAYDYLRKPFDHEELLKTVENVLDQKRLKSDRKRAHEGLRKAHDWLERRIEERTAKLTKANEQLKLEIEERKRAEEALRESEKWLEPLLAEVAKKNAELDSFVHTVSHDLRASLITIAGFTDALRDDFGSMLSEQGQKYFRYIGDAVRKMERFINHLLDFSRVARQTEKETEFPFAELVGEALKLLQPQIKAQGIEVNVQEDLPVIYGERKRLGQVVDSLLANAVKYIGKDNPSPRIDVGAKEQDGQYIFFVRDNGIGIDRDQVKDIFDIFHHLRARRDYPGIGARLAICKKIMERHGGRIWVESEAGKGSRFYFKLPRKR